MKKKLLSGILALTALFLLGAGLYNLPPIHDRLAWRVDNLRTSIKYALNPPEEVVFIPGEANAPPPDLPTMTPTLAPTSTPTQDPAELAPTPTETQLPLPSPTPLPQSILLPGVTYEDQHGRLNYCGPSNLSMALTFWGWDGNRDVVGQVVKPYADDKNVMPYEMEEFIAAYTDLKSISRVGGDLELVKKLVANGFPVILEKGTFLTDLAGEFSWMGHYQLVTGYDEARDILIVQDTYVGENHEMSYADILDGWRAFNYLFLLAYPAEREAEVLDLLGPYVDEIYANQRAAELASGEIFALTEARPRYFAWFNRGTSLGLLQDYAGAAQAYDEAFANVYPTIPQGERPWRMMWYQTGPYKAYYYSGRYNDVINLATTTLNSMSKPVLEESFYWRAMAREALGDLDGAISDLREAVILNPNFTAGKQQLERLTGGG
jgi:tetratricopeptide (TPR) repeat protein